MKSLLLSIFTFLLIGTSAYGTSFELRLVSTSCSTFRVEAQCTEAADVPGVGTDMQGFYFSLASVNSFSVSVGTSYLQQAFSSSATGTSATHYYEAFDIAASFIISSGNGWTEDTWKSIVDFTVTSGSVSVVLGTDAMTDGNGAYINTDTYAPGTEETIAASSGTVGKRWEGGTSTAWSTASNWCPSGVPAAGETVVILNQANDPVLSGAVSLGSVEIQSGATLTLNGNTMTLAGGLSGAGVIVGSSTSSMVFNGSTSSTLNMDVTQWDTTNLLQNLTVNLSGATLTLGTKVGVLGILTPTSGTLTTGGNLRICARSSSSYGQISPTGSATISGNLTVQKALSNTHAAWRHISLPVVGTIADIDSFNILDASHGVASQQNIKYWDAVPQTGNTAPGWTIASSTDDNTRGYSLYGHKFPGGKLDFDQIWSVTGTVTNGNQNFVVRNSDPVGSGGSFDNGWNLIGNPYASNLDVSTLWTTTLSSLTYKAIHIYDEINDQYVAICSSGVTIITNGGASGTPSSASVVAPFQGFWVKSSIDGTITFSNSNRTTSATGLGTFMKKNYDLARLDVYGADSSWDQTVVYFDENANGGLDNDLDAFKMYSYNPEIPSLYSVSPDGNFAINAINSDFNVHSVPLGFRSSKTGQMSFNLNTSELDAKWFVYLEDKQLGIFYDIKANPYTFNHTQNSDSRFVLHFQTYGLGAEKLVSDIQNMNISGDGSAVYVFVPAFYKDQNYQLEVIDMAGRVVYTDTKLALDHGMNTLNLNLNANAYYAVRIKAAEGIVSGKVQIR